MLNFKFCEFCGSLFHKRKNQSDKVFSKIRFCSKSCGVSNRYKVKCKPINCTQCGEVIPRKDTDTNSVYLKRKICSKGCANKSRKILNSQYKSGASHKNWNGGIQNSGGYWKVLIDDKTKYKPLHVIIMEWFLERKLEPCECVHHCNGKKDDNRLINLELMLKTEHNRLHGSIIFKDAENIKKSIEARKKIDNSKENHPMWKKDITEEKIINAVSKNKTRKDAALELGISADTLRYRLNYMRGKK